MKMVENQLERKIKCLRSDHGTEIKNTQRSLNEHGVFHWSIPLNKMEELKDKYALL